MPDETQPPVDPIEHPLGPEAAGAGGVAEDAGEMAVGSIVAPNEEDHTWDPVKAETIGRAVNENDAVNKAVASSQKNRGYLSSDAYKQIQDRDVRNASKRLQEAENDLRDQRLKQQDTEDDEQAVARLKEHRQEVVDYPATIMDRAERKIQKAVENAESPFEELYDTNPGLFANMKTADFIELGKELRRHNVGVTSAQEEVNKARTYIEEIDALAKPGVEQLPEWDQVSYWVDDLLLGIGRSNEEIKAYLAELEGATNPWRRTGMDISADYRDAIDGIRNELNAVLATKESEKQAFLDKYRPKAEAHEEHPQVSPQETTTEPQPHE